MSHRAEPKPALLRIAAVALTATALTAGTLAGCGGDGNADVGAKPGAEGVRDVVSVYAKALADGDGQRACSLMSKPAQDALRTRTKGADCLDAVKKVSPDAAAAGLGQVKFEDPQVSGDNATVKVSLAADAKDGALKALGSEQLKLVQIDARWHIDEDAAAS
ncbi:hypothetical protein ACQP2E_27830 [Actinoplanes sp. CA-015351]|uniref:hypothetical protein n=1 Tax=Actinoplanes sp. CA-015351 TaxID=3239897 RepID=UPI003D98ED62